MGRNLPPPDLLRKILRYSPVSGKLTWLTRKQMYLFDAYKDPKAHIEEWNQYRPGTTAFTSTSNGYKVGRLFLHPFKDPAYKAHRVIWAMETGQWPDDFDIIRHIDGNRANNAWMNLTIQKGKNT